MYMEDFKALGVVQYIDRVISSVDVGFLKPHSAIFEAALQAAECRPDRCVMIGNSEAKDIVPAAGLGMRTVRVAIEDERPAVSRADFVCDSLEQVAAVVRGLRS